MLSKKFEQLALEHPELRKPLRQIIEKLATADNSYLLQDSIIASLIDAPVETVRVVLDLLAESGGLSLQSLNECNRCGNLMDADEQYCSQCSGDKKDSSPVVRYRLMPTNDGQAEPTVTHTIPSQARSGGNVLACWVHLSDLHFGHPDTTHGWDQQLVLNKLLRDLEELKADKEVPCPSSALLTGDIAFSGSVLNDNEYSKANEFLQQLIKCLNFDKKDIFLVPGNHDIQREAKENKRDAARLVNAIRAGTETIEDALKDLNDRMHLFNRLSAYHQFAKDFGPPGLASLGQDMFWSHRIVSNFYTLRFVGFNTALLCLNDEDKGKLRMGISLLAKALIDTPVKDNEIIIALGHHPLRGDWLADQDEFSRWLKSYGHVYLSGHIHEPDSENSLAGHGRGFIQISAGAAHGDKKKHTKPASHGYNITSIVQLADGQLELRVWPRKWSDKTKRFVADVDSLPKAESFSRHPITLMTKSL